MVFDAAMIYVGTKELHTRVKPVSVKVGLIVQKFYDSQ